MNGVDTDPGANAGFAFRDLCIAIAAAVIGAGPAIVPDLAGCGRRSGCVGYPHGYEESLCDALDFLTVFRDVLDF